MPDPVIMKLWTAMGDQEMHVVTTEFNLGNTKKIVGGAFHGLQAVVTSVILGKQRVALLGRQTSVGLADGRLAVTRKSTNDFKEMIGDFNLARRAA